MGASDTNAETVHPDLERASQKDMRREIAFNQKRHTLSGQWVHAFAKGKTPVEASIEAARQDTAFQADEKIVLD